MLLCELGRFDQVSGEGSRRCLSCYPYLPGQPLWGEHRLAPANDPESQGGESTYKDVSQNSPIFSLSRPCCEREMEKLETKTHTHTHTHALTHRVFSISLKVLYPSGNMLNRQSLHGGLGADKQSHWEPLLHNNTFISSEQIAKWSNGLRLVSVNNIIWLS